MSNNIIWTVDGKIKDGQKEAFDAVMKDLIDASRQEQGTMNYEWTIAEDQTSFHVHERYRDVESAMIHLGSFGKLAERFLEASEITRFVVYSNITDDLQEAITGLNPEYMKPFGGFTI
ncbi:hypothetical protein GCM10009133_25460 [Cocleimonas flava]|uniref:Antibiotic biosynthesis monooxygenase n=1 Tax=Cocleimonas flava TaxID=634765 RepID=A0A4R1ERI2_9GAMM|nr:antibiotic biosynthesis monooxygenase [Cocleimonas flava]TCJ83080.1 antibiotic biosynthesis monooxygenase [Cocleimonas flava]